MGDACDGDIDGDQIWMPDDNCPVTSNRGQDDHDGDGRGMYCDALWLDHDNDGHESHIDTCHLVADPGQEDTDDDGVGNVCDDDDDNDGVADVDDNCAFTPNVAQMDINGDGIGSACAIDRDNDGVINGDNCTAVYNPDQSDMDSDGIGDVCDEVTDSDGDDVADWADNCRVTANPIPEYAAGQRDYDGDDIGDGCDDDTDGDGHADAIDNCPWSPNAGLADADGDGTGDVCDTEGVLTCGSDGELVALASQIINVQEQRDCRDCSYRNAANLTDSDPNNSMDIGVPDAQRGGSLEVTLPVPLTHGGRAGFVIATPDKPLTYDLRHGIRTRLLLDGEFVDSRELPLYDAGDGVRKMLVVETGRTFDTLYLRVAGGWPRADNVEVYAACIERGE